MMSAGNSTEAIDRRWKQFKAVIRFMKWRNAIPIGQRQHAQPETGRHADDADDGALAEEMPEICRFDAPSALSIPISRVFCTTKVNFARSRCRAPRPTR